MGVTHLGTKQTEQRETFPGCLPALPRSSISFSAQVIRYEQHAKTASPLKSGKVLLKSPSNQWTARTHFVTKAVSLPIAIAALIDTLTPQLAGPSSFDACSNISSPPASFLKHCVQRKDSRQRSINVSITTQQIGARRLLSDLCTPLTF